MHLAISLFTGIGGIDLAAEAAGFQVAVMCEIDPFCQQVLRSRFPDAVLFRDVRHITRRKLITKLYQRGYLHRDPAFGPLVGLLIGGPPCQAASLAGKRQGSADSRWMWNEWARIVGEVRPVWNVAENVPGLYTVDAGRGFGDILRSMAQMGYDAAWGSWGAADVGASHKRERVWIVAHSHQGGRGRQPAATAGYDPDRAATRRIEGASRAHYRSRNVANSASAGRREGTERESLQGSGDAGSTSHAGGHVRDLADDQAGRPVADSAQQSRRAEAVQADTLAVGRQARTVPMCGGKPVGDSISSGRGGESRRRSNKESSDGHLQPVQDLDHTEGEGLPFASGPDGRGDQPASAGFECAGVHGGGEAENRAAQSGMGGNFDGLPPWLDGSCWPSLPGEAQHPWEPPRVENGVENRVARLKAIGNAVFPAQALPLMSAIADALTDEIEKAPGNARRLLHCP